jgi:DNA-binding NtrC family response regulator
MTSAVAHTGSPPGRVIVVDDDRRTASAQARWLCGLGWHARAAGTVAEAERLLDRAPCDVCVIDAGLPAVERFCVHLAARSPTIAIVLVRSETPPADPLPVVDRVVGPRPSDADLLAAIAAARPAAADRVARPRLPTGGPLGRAPAVLEAFETAARIAATDATVLITGESGTGKSLLARAIHAASPRTGRPLVEVSCGSLAEPLLDSELFGHVAGAFTGALVDRPGRFVEADGGTIFLDEIATASPALQVRLLRVLQDRRLEPVGSSRTRTIDVRVVLATHEDLAGLVAAGRFRADLFWRINVVAIELPPLRRRRDDIPLLAEHFRRQAATRAGRLVEGFSPAALDALVQHAWPGNIRELEHAVHRAVLLGRGAVIDVGDLPPAIAPAGATTAGALKQALALPERRLILEALERHGWRRDAAARHLGINRTALYKKLKRLGMDPRSLPAPGTVAAPGSAAAVGAFAGVDAAIAPTAGAGALPDASHHASSPASASL